MKLAVLAKPETWHFRDLVRAAGGRHEVLDIDYTTLFSALDSGRLRINGYCSDGTCVDLRTVDAVLVRAMPAGTLEQVVFRMDLLGRLHDRELPVVNPPKTIETAVDKYLSLARIQNCGLPVPTTEVGQTAADAVAAFERLGGDVLSKPVFGSRGRGIVRLTSADAVKEHFDNGDSGIFYLQKFIDHGGRDLRVMVVGDNTIGMSRANPGNWLTNISHGATGARAEITTPQRTLAQAAAAAVGASYAGVDIVQDKDGALYVLEVNGCPGWKALSAVTGQDIAAILLDHIDNLVSQQR